MATDFFTRILIISGVKGDTRRYRSFHLHEQFNAAGIPNELGHITQPGIFQRAERADVIILQRVIYDRFVEKIIRVVRERGGLVILDLDDLVFDPEAIKWINSPDFMDPVRARLYIQNIQRNRQTLENCDAAITATSFLADQVREVGKPAWVHRNAFSQEMFRLSEAVAGERRSDHEKVMVGYASGTPTHNQDFAMIQTPLQKVMDRHPEVELCLVGPITLSVGWEGYEHRIRRIKLVPWRVLPKILAQFDINLAPLSLDNPFAQSKSEIKYIEAGLVRVPTIASPTNAFSHAIHPGQNGFLAAGPSEWEALLENLICNTHHRSEIGERARQDIQERYHPAFRCKELVASLNEISQTQGKNFHWQLSGALKNEDGLRIWQDPMLERHPTLIEMGLYNLRYRGLKTLLGFTWVFFRRILAPIFPYR